MRHEARPVCSAGMLFVDDDGGVLLVEPADQPRWSIPGGTVGRGETPRDAAARLLGEQLGLDLTPGRLLVVDWAPEAGAEQAGFVFDGGALTEARLDAIELRPGGIESWAYIAPEELFVMTPPRLCRRVTAALDARAAGGGTRYLEGGVPVDRVLADADGTP